MKRFTRGFTLIELLVVMALIGIILLIVVSSVQTTTSAAAQTSTRSDLQQELLNAQRLMAGRIQEAWYVFPPGQTLNLQGSSVSPLRKNPINNLGTWVTGTDPILAMVLPPRVRGTDCATDNDQCYRFFAYYPVKRSGWVGGTSGANNPGADSANDSSTWVLVEYRDYYGATPTFGPNGIPAIPPRTNITKAYLLSDYLAPTNTPGATYSMFSYSVPDPLLAAPDVVINGPGWHTPDPASPTCSPCLADHPYVSGVMINLATQRRSGGRLLRLPDASGTYTLSAAPRNLGRPL